MFLGCHNPYCDGSLKQKEYSLCLAKFIVIIKKTSSQVLKSSFDLTEMNRKIPNFPFAI
jgi:hypothetical protein